MQSVIQFSQIPKDGKKTAKRRQSQKKRHLGSLCVKLPPCPQNQWKVFLLSNNSFPAPNALLLDFVTTLCSLECVVSSISIGWCDSTVVMGSNGRTLKQRAPTWPHTTKWRVFLESNNVVLPFHFEPSHHRRLECMNEIRIWWGRQSAEKGFDRLWLTFVTVPHTQGTGAWADIDKCWWPPHDTHFHTINQSNPPSFTLFQPSLNTPWHEAIAW